MSCHARAPAAPLGEFDLIRRFFHRPLQRAVLGPGDDCALIAPTPGLQLAVSSDLLVEGRHFLPTVLPERLGHKALAVNLSDLAACGARPTAYLLGLALPRVDAAFLDGFARGLHALADAHGIELIGGDTTAGALTVAITVFGDVPPGQALRRDGARAGDRLWVSGTLGDARLALESIRGHVALDGDDFEHVRRAMEQPTPRVALGLALRGIASAAIDVSDGLVGDLGHVLAASRVGATLHADDVPRSRQLATQPLALQRVCTLAGGDDYELLFAAPPAHDGAVRDAARRCDVAVTCIGALHSSPGLVLRDAEGAALDPSAYAGFDHFAA